MLPLPDVDAAVAEIGFALDNLGLDSVALLSNVDGTYLGDPAFDPVFDELERRRAYLFVHPVEPRTPSPMPDIPVWFRSFRSTSPAVVRLIYSGTLERCPELG